METKKLLLMLISCTFLMSIFAQETEPQQVALPQQDILPQTQQVAQETDLLEAEEQEIPVEETWQYLEWEEENKDFVLKYNVIIEEYNSTQDEWQEVRTAEVPNTSTRLQITPRLGAGNYRYKIITYNLLGLVATETEWDSFIIYQAYLPSVRNVQVRTNYSNTIFLEEENDGVFIAEGRNLFITKENETDISFTEYKLVNQKNKNNFFIPEIIQHDENNRKLTLKFDMSMIDIGTYNLIATDASGLKNEIDSSSQINIKFKKWMDLDISAGYSCPVTLYDDTFKTFLDSSAWPLSMSAKVSFIPFKRRYGYLGLGLSGAYTRVFHNFETYSINGNIIFANANFIYQLPIYFGKGEKRRHALTIEAHGGGGLTCLTNFAFHYENGIDSDPLNSNNLSFVAGGAIHFYISNRLYIEANADFIMSFLPDMALGTLVPTISVGWQF